MELKKWKTVSSRICCKNQWISVREDKVRLPTKEILESYIVIEYCGAVAVIAVKDERLLLVRQYRYAVDEFTWEIPAGNLMAPGKEIESAKAELLEEAGYEAGRYEEFYKYYPSPGSSTEIIHLVIATDLKPNIETQIERDKLFNVEWMSVKDIEKLIIKGKITHSPTVVGILLGLKMNLIK